MSHQNEIVTPTVHLSEFVLRCTRVVVQLYEVVTPYPAMDRPDELIPRGSYGFQSTSENDQVGEVC